MTMIHTIQNSYTKLRTDDVTVADSSLDGVSLDSKLTDITKRDVCLFGTDVNGVEIIFSGEAVDGDTFDGMIWGISNNGWADAIAEISGTVGTAIADVTNADNTSRLFVDTINITEEFHLKEVTVADTANNRYAKIGWDTLGLRGAYVCITAVGGVGEVDRLTPWIRTF